jgi:recombination protein RecR
MRIPRPIDKLINHFERLPGIGPKTAQRLVFYLLHFPESEIQKFADALISFKQDIKVCSVCKNVGETDPCELCTDGSREKLKIAVVSSPLDLFALERSGFKGQYHVLHGLIDPLNNIGPEDIYIKDLIDRIKQIMAGSDSAYDFSYDSGATASENVSPTLDEKLEIILATNTGMEGESTSMYIHKLIKDLDIDQDLISVTRIARGLPVGGDIEYADNITLLRALEGRSKY